VRERLLGFLRVRSFQRGVLGSNRYWFAVWLGLGAASFAHRRLGKQVVVERFVLRPGDTIEIQDTGIIWGEAGEPSRRRRR
jgi:hypothetical protein